MTTFQQTPPAGRLLAGLLFLGGLGCSSFEPVPLSDSDAVSDAAAGGDGSSSIDPGTSTDGTRGDDPSTDPGAGDGSCEPCDGESATLCMEGSALGISACDQDSCSFLPCERFPASDVLSLELLTEGAEPQVPRLVRVSDFASDFAMMSSEALNALEQTNDHLRFAYDLQLLAHESEQSTDVANGAFWVQVPNGLSLGDSVEAFVEPAESGLVSNSPSSTWSGYSAVYHFGAQPEPHALFDSSAPDGGPPTPVDFELVPGVVGDAARLKSALTVPTQVSAEADLTVSMWWSPVVERPLFRRKVEFPEGLPEDNAVIPITLSPDNFDFSRVGFRGEGLSVVDENGGLLDFWIEAWNENRAFLWVKIPSKASRFVVLLYGGRSAGFSTGYQEVLRPGIRTDVWSLTTEYECDDLDRDLRDLLPDVLDGVNAPVEEQPSATADGVDVVCWDSGDPGEVQEPCYLDLDYGHGFVSRFEGWLISVPGTRNLGLDVDEVGQVFVGRGPFGDSWVGLSGRTVLSTPLDCADYGDENAEVCTAVDLESIQRVTVQTMEVPVSTRMSKAVFGTVADCQGDDTPVAPFVVDDFRHVPLYSRSFEVRVMDEELFEVDVSFVDVDGNTIAQLAIADGIAGVQVGSDLQSFELSDSEIGSGFHHFVFVFSNNSLFLYADGESMVASFVEQTPSELSFGVEHSSGIEPATLDELRLSNQLYSADRVKSEYSSIVDSSFAYP